MTRHLAVTLAVVCGFCLVSLPAFAQGSLYGILGGSGPASNATPSFLGATGLLITPTAMVAPPLKAAGYFHSIASDPNQNFWGATVGLPGGLEVSGVRLEKLEPLPADPGVPRDATVFNAKYQIPLGSLADALAPKVAVGVFDATNEVNRTYYLTLSRSLSLVQSARASLNLHAGWGVPDQDDTRLEGLFGGLDFSPFPGALIQVEYDAKDVNAGVRYSPTPWLSLDAGVLASDFAWGATLRSDW